MFENDESANRFIQLKRKIAVVLLVFVSSCLTGCGYAVTARIDGYDAFLRDYTRYYTEPMPPLPNQGESIPGFMRISNDTFVYGTPFKNGFAYVRTDSEAYLLQADGTKTPLASVPADAVWVGDKYMYGSPGTIGVRTAFGKEIFSPQYRFAQIIGDTVLVCEENRVILYKNDSYYRHSMEESAYLADENHVFCDGIFYGTDFSEKRFGDFAYADIPAEDRVMVKTENGTVGFADLTTGVVLPQRYLGARRFCSGVATVYTASGTSLIDGAGAVLYTSENRDIGEKSGKYFCYLQGGMYGAMDDTFADCADRMFPYVRYEKAVESYLIVPYATGESLYSLQTQSYLPVTYEKIEYENGLFFGHAANAITVFDASLRTIAVCEDAVFQEGVLLLCRNGRYDYFTEQQNDVD